MPDAVLTPRSVLVPECHGPATRPPAGAGPAKDSPRVSSAVPHPIPPAMRAHAARVARFGR